MDIWTLGDRECHADDCHSETGDTLDNWSSNTVSYVGLSKIDGRLFDMNELPRMTNGRSKGIPKQEYMFTLIILIQQLSAREGWLNWGIHEERVNEEGSPATDLYVFCVCPSGYL